MEKKFLLTVAYDGTRYFGWQKQPIPWQLTIQGELEKACKLRFKEEVECVGASRTDRGVHAFAQKVCIEVDTTIPAERIPIALNSALPKDIVVVSAKEVESSFHPRYDVKNKTYIYRIHNAEIRNPLYNNLCEFVYKKLDIIEMQNACKYFEGTHDFAAFCATGSSAKTTVRTIYRLNVSMDGDFILVRVTGNGFLYNMVRIIVGTLIYVGLGKIKACDIPEIISSCDRKKSGSTAGSQGLILEDITY